MRTPQRHILVVDDEQDLTTLYRMELEGRGYRVSTANTGQAALASVRGDRPDLVVMDIRMPDIDGLELMGRILSVDPSIQVVLNSAYACYQDSFLSWAADAYVLKSSDLSPLVSTVERLSFLAGAAQPPLAAAVTGRLMSRVLQH